MWAEHDGNHDKQKKNNNRRTDEEAGESGEVSADQEEPMEPSEATRYRAVVAGLNYIALDRADLGLFDHLAQHYILDL